MLQLQTCIASTMLLYAYKHATSRFTYETASQRDLEHLHRAST